MNTLQTLFNALLAAAALVGALELAIKESDVYEHKEAEASVARFEALLNCGKEFSGSLINSRRLNASHMQWIQDSVRALSLGGVAEAPVKFHRDIYHDTSLRVICSSSKKSKKKKKKRFCQLS
jgi:hypothetical protein